MIAAKDILNCLLSGVVLWAGSALAQTGATSVRSGASVPAVVAGCVSSSPTGPSGTNSLSTGNCNPSRGPTRNTTTIGGGGGGGGPVTYQTTYYEQDRLLRSGEVIEALGPTLLGDHVNDYSGTLEFTQTDVSVPGNNALPVAVGRHLVTGNPVAGLAGGLFGDWDLEIPHLHTLGPLQPNSLGDWMGLAADGVTYNFSRCSQFAQPRPINGSSGGKGVQVFPYTWWDGYHLYIPGSGEQTLLGRYPYTGYTPGTGPYVYETAQPSDGGTYPVLTNQHWDLSCLSSLAGGGSGEGFLAREPDGTLYQFDRMVNRPYPTDITPTGDGTTLSLSRSEIWILPSQITDRFGNWVKYTYDTTDGWKVLSITSSDGRTISFNYVSGTHRVSSVTDGTRTWIYSYTSSGTLQAITLPDGSSWLFAIQQLETRPYLYKRDPSCYSSELSIVDPTTYVGTITHPSGTVGSFSLHDTWHGRSNVPGSAAGCTVAGGNYVPTYFATYALVNKTLSGPGMSAQTWTWAYGTPSGSWAPCSSGCVSNKTVTITDPLGNVTVNTYGTQFNVNEGPLLSSAEGWNGSGALRTTAISYASPNAGPYPGNVGYDSPVDDWNSSLYVPKIQQVITQQGTTFTQTVNSFDTYARVTSLTRSSSLGYSRSESTSYYDQTSLWVLGQAATVTIAGLPASSVNYDPVTAEPSSAYVFGKLLNRYSFYADGTLHTVADGLGHTTTFSSYMRGLPQNIAYADGTSVSAVVNNIGVITSATNEANTTWTYGYDAIGRLASATPPTGDPVQYNTRNYSFVQVPSNEYGIAANHWRQTITQGAATTINYFDARWRKLLTVTYDSANVAGTQRFQLFNYDPYNRTTFTSYPISSVSSVTASVSGQNTSYDALGRVTGTSAASELGTLTTTTQYLNGFQTQFTDARGYSTTRGFQAFDDPDSAALVSATLPEGVNLSITRDLYQKALSITRSGTYNGASVSATRSYVYDANQLLCKVIEPETGATIQALDAANNISWRASGQNLTGTSTCDTAGVPAASQITFTYDARNRVTGTSYGDGSPSVANGYTADGLLGSTTAGGSTWTYSYNNRRLLTGESLSLNSTTLGVGHGYDANGHVSTLTYPDGTVVSYSPDALGEPTQVSGSASGITFRADGTVAGFTYANGIVHTRTENVRGLPLNNTDGGILNDQYTYNANGSVTGITDLQAGVTTRSFDYDGLNRLTLANATGVWGSGSYGYDPLDNIRTSVVGSRSSTHNYDATNRLISIVNGSGTVAYGYDIRGNVTSRGAQTFSYDLANRMQSATGVETATYDGHFRRVAVTKPDCSVQIWFYDLDGEMLYQLRTSSSAPSVATRYIYLDGHLISEVSSSTGTTFVHTDALGSPVKRTNVNGALISGTTYEPFGNTAAGTTPVNDVGFTGHVNAPELGLVYMQARYYDSIAGRFISVDPISTNTASGDDFNLYAYVGNDPLDRTDPTGAYSCGSSLSASQCQAFTQAQDQAKQQITSTVGTLSTIQSKVISGEGLTASEQKVADQVGKVLGKGAGTDAKALGSLIGTASKLLAQLAGNTPAEFGGASGGESYARADPGQLTLFSKFFGQSTSAAAQTVAHEAHHHGAGGLDITLRYGKEIVSPYGFAAAVRRAEILNDPARSLEVPDPTTFALGFTRDDDK